MVRMSYPLCSNLVAKECLKVWQPACLYIPQDLIASLTERCKVLGEVYHLFFKPRTLSSLIAVDGKRNCQAKDRSALGYFFLKAFGKETYPAPFTMSSSNNAFLHSMCFFSASISLEGSTVILSFFPLPDMNRLIAKVQVFNS